MSVVLTLGDRQIQTSELLQLLAQYQLLPRLARELMVDQVIADIELSVEEKEQALAGIYQRMQIGSPEQQVQMAQQMGMTSQQLEDYLLRDIKLEHFKRNTWDNELEGRFLTHKDQLDKVVYSLIRTRDPGIAQELFFRIQEGEAGFTDLAREYSEGGEAQTGGLIGPVELNTPHPKIKELLKSNAAGKLIPPTQVGEWWIILRLEKYIASVLDEPLRQRLRNDLFQQWLSNQLQSQVSFTSPQPSEPETISAQPTTMVEATVADSPEGDVWE